MTAGGAASRSRVLRGVAPDPDGPVRGPVGARASYLAYRTGAELARIVPAGLGEPAARVVGRAIALGMPSRRRQVERNLRRATGGGLRGVALQKAVGETFDSYTRYWWELFRLPNEVGRELEMEVTGRENLAGALERGSGAVIALPHVGGWEFAGAWMAGQGWPPMVVVEPVEPPELFEWFASTRRALGMTVVQLGPEAGKTVLRALHHNQAVCLLCDRDLTGDGVPVEFFGEATTLPGGPAMLALRTGAPLLPTAVYFRPQGGHHAVVQPPLPAQREGRLRDDVARVTQALAQRFEDLIRAAPEQWHLMQPNWPSDRSNGAAATL